MVLRIIHCSDIIKSFVMNIVFIIFETDYETDYGKEKF